MNYCVAHHRSPQNTYQAFDMKYNSSSGIVRPQPTINQQAKEVRPTVRKVDHDSRREEVAEAAARLIAEKGLEALTTRALAKSLGCSIGVLSHYFSSKEEIVIAAFRWADQRIDLRMQEASAQGNLSLDHFFPIIKAGLPLDEESDLEWRVRLNLHTFALTHQDSLEAELEKNTQNRSLMHTMIKALQAQGELRSDIDAEDITNIAFDLVIGMAKNLIMRPFSEREARAEYLFRMIEQLRPAN